MKGVNATFAFLSLIIIQKILYTFKISEKQVVLITCLTGFSFSILRYATENETYIIPLFFALLASLNYAKFFHYKTVRFVLHAGIFATIAVLFHQMYVFWWMGLLGGFFIEKKKKYVFRYLLISLIGPVVYLFVAGIYGEGKNWSSILNFILGDFRENASLGLTFKGIVLSGISLIRSFIQVHGYIYNMIRANILLLIPGVASFLLVLFALRKLPAIKRRNISGTFGTVHIIIILLQFTFALLSYGNAEFMVMIPVLIFLLVPLYISDLEDFLSWIIVAMALWNISYGVIPLHSAGQGPEQFLCDMAKSGKNAVIIASDDQLLKSMLYYQTGEKNMNCILRSPAAMKRRGEDQHKLEADIGSALDNGVGVFTNCLDKEAISRQSIIEGNENQEFFSEYESILIKTWTMSTGIKSIYKVEIRRH